MWAGPEPGRITQHKQQTRTVDATLVQLIYYCALLGSAITPGLRIAHLKPDALWSWRNTGDSECAWLIYCWNIVQSDFVPRKMMPFTLANERKAQVGRKYSAVTCISAACLDSILAAMAGKWFILLCNMIKQNLISSSNILRQEWTLDTKLFRKILSVFRTFLRSIILNSSSYFLFWNKSEEGQPIYNSHHNCILHLKWCNCLPFQQYLMKYPSVLARFAFSTLLKWNYHSKIHFL